MAAACTCHPAHRNMVTSTSRAKQTANLKHVVKNILDIDHLNSYLMSISISLIGSLLDAILSKIEETSLPNSGQPQNKYFASGSQPRHCLPILCQVYETKPNLMKV